MSPPADLAARVAATVGSAGVLMFISPPANLHFLHWFAYVPMLWALRPGERRANVLLAWLFGIVSVGTLFRWIVDTIALFSNIPWLGAIGILLLFAAVFGAPALLLWPFVHSIRSRLGSAWILLIPALQVVIEYLSMYVLLFPYNHGVSQFQTYPVWQLVSVTGVWGVTWLVFFVNCALAEAIYRRREGRPPPFGWIATAVLTLSIVIVWGSWRYERVEAGLREAPVVRIAQLQTKRTMQERMQMRARNAYDLWKSATEAIPPGAADLVVWPEGASPYPLQNPKMEKEFAAMATRGRFEMIVGGGARQRVQGTETGMRAFNSVYHVSAEGAVTKRYDKMVPLPFGEYMPLEKTRLGFLVSWIEGPGDFQAGTEAVTLEGERFKYATPICYEAILSGTCRKFSDADLFVTVTNDAWFGDTAAPHQHAMLAAVRATELGTPMYRSAYTGVSMVVEPHGVIHSATEPFTDVHRIVGVRVARFPTLYARLGDWFVLACTVGLLGAGIAMLRGRFGAPSHAPAHRAPHVSPEGVTHGGGSGD